MRLELKIFIFDTENDRLSTAKLGPEKKKPGFGTLRATPRRLQTGLVRLELKICIFDTENDRFSTAKLEPDKSQVL